MENNPRYRPILILALAVLTFAVYLSSMQGGFVYDDNLQIIKNPWIKDPAYLKSIFTTHSFGFMMDRSQGRTYRPLVFAVYMLEYGLFGLKPFGWHLVNVAWHFFNSVLVLLAAGKLLADKAMVREDDTAASTGYAPLLAAVIFAVHPANSEVTSWVGCVPELAYTTLCLGAFYLHVTSDNTARARFRTAAYGSALFFAALFFKETSIILPVLVFIYDRLKGPDEPVLSRGTVKGYVPYAAAFALYVAIRLSVMGTTAPPNNMRPYLSNYQYALSALELLRQELLMLSYTYNDYPFPYFKPVLSITEPRSFLTAAAVVAAAVAAFVYRKRIRPIYLLAVSFIMLPLLPILYAAVIIRFPYADRYLYFPSIGAAIGAAALYRGLSSKNGGRYAWATAIIALAVIAAYSSTAWGKSLVWKDDVTLWGSSFRAYPENYAATYYLGEAYLAKGMTDEAVEVLTEGVKAGKLSPFPDPAIPYIKEVLAMAYDGKGMTDKAIAVFEEIVREHPGDFTSSYNLATLYKKAHRCDEAIKAYGAALSAAQDDARRRDVYYSLGNCYFSKGLYRESLSSFKEALRLSPGDPDVIRHIGMVSGAIKGGR